MSENKYSNGVLHTEATNISSGNGGGCAGSSAQNRGACASAFRSTPAQAVHIEEDDVDDEYCIYTYKGDPRGADLPSSFFTFDQGDSLSSVDENSPSTSCLQSSMKHRNKGSSASTTTTMPNNGRPTDNNVVSSDMDDFLDMDFDPGGGDEEDEDDISARNYNERSDENGMPSLEDQLRENSPVPSVQRTCPLPSTSSEHASRPPINSNIQEVDVTDGTNPTICSNPGAAAAISPVQVGTALEITGYLASNSISTTHSPSAATTPANPSLSPQPHCSKVLGNEFQQQNRSHLNPQLYIGQESWSPNTPNRQIMMRLVKSSTLPEMGSRVDQSSIGDAGAVQGMSPRISKNSCLSSSAPLIKNETRYRAVINTSSKSPTTEDDSVEFDIGSIMIWTVEDALLKSLMQIGASACGATAVCTVLKVLGYDHLDPAYVNSCVKTRLRDETAEIPEYLFSRSVAGATHEDLIQAIRRVTNGMVNGRFFQPKPDIEAERFCKWLLHWICKGAVPVVTRNMQVVPHAESQQPIADAWHHQMVFGISPDGIFMTNPVIVEPATLVIPQLTSPSVLLIRRSDVVNRRNPSTDLRKLTRHPDHRWNEFNVLGQVANLLLEEVPVFSNTSIAKRVRTSHIKIPAAYKGGVTLFMPSNSPFYPLLMEASEL